MKFSINIKLYLFAISHMMADIIGTGTTGFGVGLFVLTLIGIAHFSTNGVDFIIDLHL